jgi:hypothetical protein
MWKMSLSASFCYVMIIVCLGQKQDGVSIQNMLAYVYAEVTMFCLLFKYCLIYLI